MPDYLSAEISATCAALGYYDGTKYLLERDCKETLKDLIRYLKRDDDTHRIRRFLGNTKLVQTDLIKIIIEHSDKPELFDVLLRLTVNLTTPALLLYNQEFPTNKESHNNYLEIIGHLQNTKLALGDEQFWTTICKHLTEILNIPSMERTEEKGLVVERILTLVRNALWVPVDVEGEKRTESDGTIHDQLLFALHVSGMVDVFLYIASNSDEQHYQLHILEIVSLMLREQNAAQLASSGTQRSALEKERDEANLVAVREKAKTEKIQRARKYAGSRHSRFGGTFVVTNLKAIGDHNMICHKPFAKLEDLQFSQLKKKIKRPKNKAAMADPEAERRSALSVRLFLREFCVEFLNGAYNPVMKYARFCIMGTDRAQENDESYYLFALRYFMEFNRHNKFEIKYVSETISTEIFYLVQRQLERYYEMIVVDKKKIPLWSRRLHLALKAYRELLHTIMAMDRSKDDGVRMSSKVIKSNIFYVPEYRETLLTQLLYYNDVKMSRKFLADLIETVHIFLKMLEHYCGKGQAMVVQRIKNKQRRRTKQQKKSEAPAVLSIEDRWNAVTEQLAAVIQSGTIPDVMPFDATLDTPIDDQKADAMMRIQRYLRRRQPEEAVGLIRAAREVWPENDSFGSAEMSPEEELAALRAIFFADFSSVAGYVDADETVSGEGGSLTGNTELGDLEVGEGLDEDEEEEETTRVEEADFEFKDFLHRFVNVKVVKACALLLANFAENTVEVNYSVVKLLHRIAVECKMSAMMFQATIFQIFQKIFESKNPEHKELVKFAKFIVRKFAEVAKNNPKVYMELLFWKTTKEANELVEGYGSSATSEKEMRGAWTESEEDELRILFMEHQTNKHPQDLIDWLLEHISSSTRTRRGVMKKLKEMHLIVNSKAVRNEVQKRLPKEWGEEEIAQLTEIWEKVKDDEDPIDMIYTELRLKRPKPKIKEKLLEIGLAKDRKELRKKRSKKNGAGKSDGRNESESESDSENERDDDEISEVSARRAPPKTKTKKRVIVPKSKNRPTMIYTSAQLSGLLKHVLEKNGKEALEWIKESLEDVVDDRDEESSEGVPLVPITDIANASMDSPSFQRFLRALGIEPPADEQEIYWRIPAHMLTSTIRKRCDLIGDALEGKFVEEEESQPPATNSQNESDDDDVDIFENVKKYFIPKDNAVESEDLVEEVRASGSGVVSRRTSVKTARKGTDFESEEQEAEKVIVVADGSNDVTVVSVDAPSQANTSRLRSILIDSDSDHDAQEVINLDEQKRVRSDNSEHEESPAPKKRRLIDSDDEADEAPREVTSHRAMVISDDED